VAVQLLATPEVRQQVEELAAVFPRKLRIPAQADLAENTRAVRGSYLKLLPTIRDHRKLVIAAMRADADIDGL
jgi:hypothetical protein